MRILKEQFPYRWCESDDADRGWIEKHNRRTNRYCHMYECDSALQLLTTIEDYQYTLWLDPDRVPCYRKERGDVIRAPHNYE